MKTFILGFCLCVYISVMSKVKAGQSTIDIPIPMCGAQLGWGADVRSCLLDEKTIRSLEDGNAILIGVHVSGDKEGGVIRCLRFELNANFVPGSAIHILMDRLNVEAITSAAQCRIIRRDSLETMDPRIVTLVTQKIKAGDLIILSHLIERQGRPIRRADPKGSSRQLPKHEE